MVAGELFQGPDCVTGWEEGSVGTGRKCAPYPGFSVGGHGATELRQCSAGPERSDPDVLG